MVNRMLCGRLAIVVVCVLMALWLASVAAAETGQQAVAQVGSKTITWSDLADRAARMYGAQVLDELINEAVIEQAASANGATVTDSEVDQRLADMSAGVGSAAAFADILSSAGVSRSVLRYRVRSILLAEKALGITVTPEEARAYFDANKKSFDEPAQVRLQRIVVGDAAAANAAIDRLKKGEKFEDVSAAVSKYPDIRTSKGEFGWWVKGSGRDAAIDKAASETKLRSYSQPFASGGDYYIIYVAEEKPARQAAFDEVQSRATYVLRSLKLRSQLPNWLPEQRTKFQPKVLITFD